MGHDPRVGQASHQASEVDQVGAGLPPRRTDPREGTPPGASHVSGHVKEADKHQSCQPAPGQPRTESQPNQAGILTFQGLTARRKSVSSPPRPKCPETLLVFPVDSVESGHYLPSNWSKPGTCFRWIQDLLLPGTDTRLSPSRAYNRWSMKSAWS
jgi:hypothetical protein